MFRSQIYKFWKKAEHTTIRNPYIRFSVALHIFREKYMLVHSTKMPAFPHIFNNNKDIWTRFSTQFIFFVWNAIALWWKVVKIPISAYKLFVSRHSLPGRSCCEMKKIQHRALSALNYWWDNFWKRDSFYDIMQMFWVM